MSRNIQSMMLVIVIVIMLSLTIVSSVAAFDFNFFKSDKQEMTISTTRVAAQPLTSATRNSLRPDTAFWRGLPSVSTEFHISDKSVSGNTAVGETFTVSVTASDGDDLVTRISLGKVPYMSADFEIRDCTPASNSCTVEFDLSESTAGTYTYMIKAKNARNQIVNDAITVTVVEDATAATFNFRTAALDGKALEQGRINYLSSYIIVGGQNVADFWLVGEPFATFSVPSDELLSVEYQVKEYITDVDHLYLDSRLPTCSGSSCSFIADTGDEIYTTTCNLIISDYHYLCTMADGDGYSISFDYRATSDTIGPNTVRRYNRMYPQAAPIVNFGNLNASFEEGSSFTITLDDYVYDADTSASDIAWSVRAAANIAAPNIAVTIDASTREATITQISPDWIGNELVTLVATDPEGNTGSDTIAVQVMQDTNQPPVITAKMPDLLTVSIGLGGSRLFSIRASDPDHDPITITWRKGGTVVANNVFNYLYLDTIGVPRTVQVTVSDGTSSVMESWDVNIIAPIGTIEGVVRDAGDSSLIQGVFVEALVGTTVVSTDYTDFNGGYSFSILEGTYTLRFSHLGHITQEVFFVPVTAGEVTVRDVNLEASGPETGTVEGTITDSYSGAAVQGALVEVKSGITVVNSTTTDASGSYSLDVISGLYTVNVSSDGYKSAMTGSMLVSAGSTVTADLSLDAWWDSNWAYRKSVDMTSSEATTDYTVFMNVTYESGMNVDFSDLRFLAEDNTAVLDYWVEDKVDGEWAGVWVEFDSIMLGTNQESFMYYGNLAAASSSDGPSAFIIWDDFEDGILDPALWLDVSTGGASAGEGGGQVTLQYNSNNRGYLRTLAGLPSDIEVMLDAKLENNQAQFYTFLQWDGTHTGPWDTIISDHVHIADEMASDQSMAAVVGGVYTGIGTSTSIVRSYTFHSYKFNQYAGNYEYWLDGQNIISGYNETVFSSQYLGFSGREINARTYIDNVKVRKFISPEPTYQFGTEDFLI
ncbi:MAG: DUF2341 domain-containing protein [Candidatus Woesearchaeota archaeon]